jgi:hypothetical protein
MRVATFLGLVALLGCTDSAAPTTDVTGIWASSDVQFGMTLELTQRGDSVQGSGSGWAFSALSSPTFAIAGKYARPQLALTFSSDTLVLAHFTGTVSADGARLVGVETFTSGADTLIFVRQR